MEELNSEILLELLDAREFKKLKEKLENMHPVDIVEVMEEVGLKVKNLHFYKSQPWSFTDTLLFGFFCDLDGDDTISLDEEELSMAVWMDRDQIPDDEYGISLTREMMTVFKNGQDKFYE